MKTIRTWMVFFAALLILFGPILIEAQATTTSAVQTVSLSLTISEGITVSVTPASVTFTNYSPNTNIPGSSPLTVNTSYNSNGTEVGLSVCAYFSTTNALINSGPTILASNVFATVTGTASTGLGAPNDGFPPSTGTSAFIPASTAGKGCSGFPNGVVV